MRIPEKSFIRLRGHDCKKKEMTFGSYWKAGFQEGKWHVRTAKEEPMLSKMNV